jgi:hypothetical protein
MIATVSDPTIVRYIARCWHSGIAAVPSETDLIVD